MSVIPVTPGVGRNVATYQDGSSNDHPAGVMEYLVGSTPTAVASGTPLPVGVQGSVAVTGTFWQATQPVSVQAATSGGATPYHLVSAATTNAASVKGSAGVLYGVAAFNTNASARFLKVFDKATAPTPGTDTPVLSYLIPPSNGGLAIPFPAGVQFAAGIAIAITGAMADNDATSIGASDCVVDLIYK